MKLSYKTYNNNNGYELDIQPEDEKKSGDKGSDDMEGVENINVLDVEDIDILEDEDLYNNDDHVEEDKLELKKGMTFEIWKIAETYLENFAKQQGFSFPKGVQINSIIHSLNPLIIETAPKFRRLTNEMLEKIKFWTIEGKMGMPNQYNLLVASFPDKTINRKDLSNATEI
ncbi:unnamed protein product [Rhizophagus irregularis]|nr:unnamed protein product [Rhizophagus irregularis]